MPINAYTGLMGSGKSYEVVSEVIVPAIAKGRRVVTNVDGIDGHAIAAYCVDKLGVSYDKCGSVLHVTNEQCHSDDFLPFGDSNVATVCLPGDLVCIDEAWRVWGSSEKINKRHAIFFREHRHYAHPETKVTCDLVVMVQHISDLHRQLKTVVELSFKTKKLKTFGLNKAYVLQMWEGSNQKPTSVIKTVNKRYNPAIFPLYQSYAGGHGQEVAVDARQNVLSSKKLWALVAGVLLCCALCMWFLYGVFHPRPAKSVAHASVVGASSAVAPGLPSAMAAVNSAVPALPRPPSAPRFSTEWRLAGYVFTGRHRLVVLADTQGRLRFEDPSVFVFLDGEPSVGVVDGERVTSFSGELPGGAGHSGGPPSVSVLPAAGLVSR